MLRTGLATAVLVLVAACAPRLLKAHLGRSVLLAAVRATAQLFAVGTVIAAVFRAPLAVAPLLAVMGSVAVATATGRLAEVPMPRSKVMGLIGLALAAGVAATTSVVFATGALQPTSRNVIAVVGSTFGGGMTACTLAGRRYVAEVRSRRPEVEGALALGATPRAATEDLVRVAMREALLPALDQTRTVGLVVLPGAFIGALVGGAAPLEAARFQLIVLAGLLAAESIATVVLLSALGRLRHLPDPAPGSRVP